MIILFKKTLAYLTIFLVINSCSAIKDLDFLDLSVVDDIQILEGTRVDISASPKEVQVNIEASKLPITLEETLKNSEWNKKGKNNYNAPENMFVNENLELLWKKDVGDGEGTYNKIYTQPVGNENV